MSSGAGGAPASRGSTAGDSASGSPVAGEAGEAGAVPAVWPRPRSIRAAGRAVPLGGGVRLVAGPDADPRAVGAVRDALARAGVPAVPAPRRADRRTGLRAARPAVLIGGAGARDALRALHAPRSAGMPSGGYRVASGTVADRAVVALDGTGDDGLFHAAVTFRQLIVRGAGGAPADSATADGPTAGTSTAEPASAHVPPADGNPEGPGAATGGPMFPGVMVKDWPATAVRGVTEGFYGRPWSQEDRLALLDFMGRTKQNRYLYAPGDDPYRLARWRDAYPAARRADFRRLAVRAAADHVTPAWAVAPAQAMCMASDDDARALARKAEAMWMLGVRAFQLQFQDVSYSEWHCGEDADTFGSGPRAAARAQARVANVLARHLRRSHPGAAPLSVMPTEYYQSGASPYRTALARWLDPSVQVAWTGVGVVPRTITARELAAARSAFDGRPLVTADNYPVNDYEEKRLFLGPYRGRDAAVAGGSAGVLANAMQQAAASRVPLFTAADYAWNPYGYDPRRSWGAAVDDLAGGDARARQALGALAANDASSVLDPSESEYLKPLMDSFWETGAGTRAAARDAAAARLKAAFAVMAGAPEALAGTADGALAAQARPWLAQLSRYGKAGGLAVDLLQDQAHGDGAAAWRASLALGTARRSVARGASSALVGRGVLDAFLARAVKVAADWTGADRADGTNPVATSEGYTVELTPRRPLDSVTVMTEPGTGTGAAVEAYAPGAGWRTLGPVSASGWTRVAGRGLRAEALRVSWPGADPASRTGPGSGTGSGGGTSPGSGTGSGGGPGGSEASTPLVRRVVPWYADGPEAGLALGRTGTDVQSGGGAATVPARLTALRPDDVRGALTAKAPAGITVRAPRATTVPRGRAATVPVRLSASRTTPSGTYTVPLEFGGARRTLTVRVSPRVSGPDLAREPGALASSSGDETGAFPARAATDGDQATRWSSPPADEQWWQVRLARPAHVGQVVLTWQDAYAARYRVQTSADGRRWHTAATVTDGSGGREAIGVDAPGARYVRMRGERRATAYGYSLFSAEVYGVSERARTHRGSGADDAPSGAGPADEAAHTRAPGTAGDHP
jgi:hyaluronoglucosaminidase